MTAVSTEPTSPASAGRGSPRGAGAASAAGHAADGYTARHLTVLEGLDAVRKRPGMYIGSTDGRGLAQCLGEIFDNSVDEALAGSCNRIEVILYADGSAEVRDNGRGIPVDNEPKTGLSGVELIMTRLHAGGKFGGGSYTASGGLHGVGASVVNALSGRLDVCVQKAGYEWTMSFRRGVPGKFAGDGPDAAFTPGSGIRKGAKVAKTATGTTIRFWPDRQIFVPGAEWKFAWLAQQARQTAYLVPGLSIRVADERPPRERADESQSEDSAHAEESVHAEDGRPAQEAAHDGLTGQEAEFRFAGGISEFCAHLSSGEAVTDIVRITGSGMFTETVPVLDDAGHLTPTEVERQLEVDVALRWDAGYDTTLRSFVNVIPTAKGGTHVTGFERAMVRTLNEQLKAARLLKAGEDPVIKEDVLEGLTGVISVRLPEPQFEGQTKEVLGTPAATKIVSQVVATELGNFLEGRVRGSKQQARAVLDKVISAAKTRIAAREHRENQRRKSALATSALPAKLVDCRSADDRSELFIVEGDSALGTAKNARDSEFQALLPIRGKILNVQKASLADMLKNAECAAIIQVIGPARQCLRPGLGALPARDLHGRCRRGRRAYPHPAAHALPPVHAPDGRGRPGVRGCAAAAPDRAHQSAQGTAEVHLLLQRRRAAPHAAGAGAQGAAVQGAATALQGPGRDGRASACRDDHGSAAADLAPDQDRGHRRRPEHVRPAHGQRGRSAP